MQLSFTAPTKDTNRVPRCPSSVLEERKHQASRVSKHRVDPQASQSTLCEGLTYRQTQRRDSSKPQVPLPSASKDRY